MNLYEFEGKQLFEKYGIAVPRGVVVRRGEDVKDLGHVLHVKNVVVKAQVLSGKRGKNNAIRFVENVQSVEGVKNVQDVVNELFDMEVRGQYVAAVRIEEKLDIAEEHYMSITYDTNSKQPVLIYSKEGGVDIEDVPEEKIFKLHLDIREKEVPLLGKDGLGVVDSSEDQPPPTPPFQGGVLQDVIQNVWDCFLGEDARLVEINPLVKTADGQWVAADAKVALDDDAFFRHKDWKFESRTMMGREPTELEKEGKKIDEGEDYYRGTAGKYIEMDGDIAILFSGGGASIANMDALIKQGLKPANYTEYSGNPPREKVAKLAKIVLSKPGLRGLWIAGGVANFTNVKETFQGIVDALDGLKLAYPIVVRRAGPFEKEGMELMKECAERNGLNMKLFGKEVSMSETAKVLAEMVVADN